MGAPDVPENLAKNLFAVRERRGLTQAALAKLAGVPRSTLATIEAGDANPTLKVLVQLSEALRLSLEELLSSPLAPCELFKAGSLPVREQKSGAARVQKLLPHPIPGMEIDRMTLKPGARVVGVPHRPGTHEYLYCETGAMRLDVAGEGFDLAAGDVAAFPGDQRHSYKNVGRSKAVGFSVVTLAPVARLAAKG